MGLNTKHFISMLLGPVLICPALGLGQSDRLSIVEYGAVGDGKTNNAAAIKKAIAAAARAGGGTVEVPPGDFMSGPITLLSNVTLHLESGSLIRGSTRLEDYWLALQECTTPNTRIRVLT